MFGSVFLGPLNLMISTNNVKDEYGKSKKTSSSLYCCNLLGPNDVIQFYSIYLILLLRDSQEKLVCLDRVAKKRLHRF